jgi:thiamine-phosphate pyrophosphorylase
LARGLKWGKPSLNLSVYVILDEKFLTQENTQELVEAVIAGGATVIQYRAKKKSAKDIYNTALVIRSITKKHHIPFIVNDRPDIALAVGADGVHIGQKDLPPQVVRKLIGERAILGMSTHTLSEVAGATKLKELSYISFGPVFPTKTKENAGAPVGTEKLCKAVKLSSLPVVVVGGINFENIHSVLTCSPAGVAVAGAILSSENPEESTKALRREVEKATKLGK